ncbi:MAG: fructosamine kinase family protein [Synechococcus sp.]
MQTDLEQILGADPTLLAGARVDHCMSLGGGGAQQAWRLQLNDGRCLFAKRGDAASLKAEQIGLAALHACADSADLVVPEPLALLASPGGLAVLLLPWLDQHDGEQQVLGRGLARLHRRSLAQTSGRFGWPTDGFIGLGPQPAGWRERWGDAFVDLRLRPQLQLARSWGLSLESLEAWLSSLRGLLNEHDAEPVLVHGDLWAGNAGMLCDGRGFLIDPASWWADREVDLAMTHLFGGFQQSFYGAYAQDWPLAPGATDRIAIYNLYHLLNHANLFGGSYRQQSRQAIRHLQQQFG